jgi:eukaryotic-like serine/threonine-protein kinase
VRKTDGSPVVRLGEGWAADLSPDGLWALAVVPSSPDRLMVYPTGPGEARRLESGEIREYSSARWFPDAKRVLVCGTGSSRVSRCYTQEISGGAPRPVTPEGTRRGIVSPDGTLLLVQGARDEYELFPSAGGAPRKAPGLKPTDVVFEWSADGRSVFEIPSSEVPGQLERVELATGGREFLRRLAPADLAGVVRIYQAIVAGDEKSYGYSAVVRRDDLFLVEGAR